MAYKYICSVIVPIYNEEKHIRQCYESIKKQTFNLSNLELIFVDGRSTDATRNIVTGFITEGAVAITLLDNPQKIVPVAMNLGIKEAKGKYIIRLDAHTEYSPDYIQNCIETLEKTDADNVGGVAIAKSQGYIGNAISYALSSIFGVGASIFRIGGYEGEVDTVPFGAFRRETFTKYGLYDERLVRNQDIELNYRIRNNGGKVYMSPKIKCYYLNRDTLKGLWQQNYHNGMWNIITYKLCPGSLSIRHFVPFVFVTSLLLLTLLSVLHSMFAFLLIAELALYLTCNLYFSLRIGLDKGFKYFLILPVIFSALHVSYGLGSIGGLIRLFKLRKIS